MSINLYNTLTRQKEELKPLVAKHVRMYVCGPTVYDRAHLGNARSVVVYDVLYRLLRHVYGEKQVTYVRNITDVDDKINKAAVERGITIQALTKEVIDWFHDDMTALNCLRPNEEPKATEHIPHMIEMIDALIANGHAYVAEGHVLFDVMIPLTPNSGEGAYYGMLSGRSLDDLIAGARVEVAPYKKSPGDFVLWKPAAETDDASSKFDSPWGVGRPGWHIECSAMATELLGDNFDIHGGGADLMFPHHENEIAQACAANPGSTFAKVWVHNGFLTVGGEKMSKSLGNFTTVRDLLEKGVHGEVIRFALLSTHYRKPLDWTDKLVDDAKKQLDYFYRAIKGLDENKSDQTDAAMNVIDWKGLLDDLNISSCLVGMQKIALEIHHPNFNDNDFALNEKKRELKMLGSLLGFLNLDPETWFKGEASGDDSIQVRIEARKAAKAAKNWAEADRIREELKAEGILLEDKPGDVTEWRRV